MDIGPGVTLDESLIASLIDCGQRAHELAQAHHNDPGSNGFTFGTDRYQRATELATGPLVDHGYDVRRRGAGLVARRDGTEVHFAVARGDDLTDPANFDADSSPARRRAAANNTDQLPLAGMPQPAAAPVVHVVWSGTTGSGLTAVHAGRLVVGAGDRLDWAVLVRLDQSEAATCATDAATEIVPAYAEQPVPALHLSARKVDAATDEG
jgi:hypothetical protein